MATYTYTSKIVTFTAPATGVYDLVAYGRKVEAQAAAWERRSAEISRSRRARRCRSPWAASGRPTLSPPTPAQTGPAGAVGTGQGGSGGSGGYGGQPSGEAGAGGGGFKGAGISGNGYSGGQGFPILTGGTGSFGPRRPGLLVEARLQRGDAHLVRRSAGPPMPVWPSATQSARPSRPETRSQTRSSPDRRSTIQSGNAAAASRSRGDQCETPAKTDGDPGGAAPRHRHRRRPSAVALVWKPRYGERHAEQRQKPALLLPEAPNRRRLSLHQGGYEPTALR